MPEETPLARRDLGLIQSCAGLPAVFKTADKALLLLRFVEGKLWAFPEVAPLDVDDLFRPGSPTAP